MNAFFNVITFLISGLDDNNFSSVIIMESPIICIHTHINVAGSASCYSTPAQQVSFILRI